MRKTIREIAALVKGEVAGDPNIPITGARGIREAREGDVTFLSNRRYAPLLKETQASAVLVPLDVKAEGRAVIRVADPSLAFAQIIAVFAPAKLRHPKGIHKKAVIAKTAKLAKGAAVGACAVIEDGAVIGANTVIYGGSYIGRDVRVGRDCIFYPNVSIRERVTIGDRVFIQSGAVIGSEGFGYVEVDGAFTLVPQVGTVVIEDDVEIGANVTIDRARFDRTLIGRGTKIDNLVQIAHNVVTGESCIIVAQAGISGSTQLGKKVTIAGQAGLVGHITIGDGAICAAQAGVIGSVPPHTMVSGYPARPHAEAMKVYAALQRLPQTLKEIAELKKKIKALEERSEKS
ncbi:MAG: UDP-3-O-(3-hydroxymyristoyl)glucosamine N-acyltransferase [Deltaproteobacteria bacterium]